MRKLRLIMHEAMLGLSMLLFPACPDAAVENYSDGPQLLQRSTGSFAVRFITNSKQGCMTKTWKILRDCCFTPFFGLRNRSRLMRQSAQSWPNVGPQSIQSHSKVIPKSTKITNQSTKIKDKLTKSRPQVDPKLAESTFNVIPSRPNVGRMSAQSGPKDNISSPRC